MPSELPLLTFVRNYFPDTVKIEPLRGDASMRRYYRGVQNEPPCSFIVMDSSADRACFARFVHLTAQLHRCEIAVPTIYHHDMNAGWLLSSDDGVCLEHNVSRQPQFWLEKLATLLHQWQEKTKPLQKIVPPHDDALIREELSRFDLWFVPQFMPEEQPEKWQNEFALIAQKLIDQPQVTIHRDFHSRNLLFQKGIITIIDYQDALSGALCYDLVSLTRDVYQDYPVSVASALEMQFQKLFVPQQNPQKWRYDCHITALQRHLKILGLFVRLAKRDGKRDYLPYLARTWALALDEVNFLAADLPILAATLTSYNRRVREQLIQFNHESNDSSRGAR